jgi:hypothetical protein
LIIVIILGEAYKLWSIILPYTKEPTIGSYLEPSNFSPHIKCYFIKNVGTLSSHLLCPLSYSLLLSFARSFAV